VLGSKKVLGIVLIVVDEKYQEGRDKIPGRDSRENCAALRANYLT
jgi:hypothetical protein